MNDQPVNLIDQRVIETNALVPVIRAFGEKIGLEGAPYCDFKFFLDT